MPAQAVHLLFICGRVPCLLCCCQEQRRQCPAPTCRPRCPACSPPTCWWRTAGASRWGSGQLRRQPPCVALVRTLLAASSRQCPAVCLVAPAGTLAPPHPIPTPLWPAGGGPKPGFPDGEWGCGQRGLRLRQSGHEPGERWAVNAQRSTQATSCMLMGQAPSLLTLALQPRRPFCLLSRRAEPAGRSAPGAAAALHSLDFWVAKRLLRGLK